MIEENLVNTDPWWWSYVPLFLGIVLGVMAGQRVARSWAVGVFTGSCVGSIAVAVGFSPYRPVFGLVFLFGLMLGILVVAALKQDDLERIAHGEDDECTFCS